MIDDIQDNEIDYAAASETMGPAPPRGARRRSDAEALAGGPAFQSAAFARDAAAAYDVKGDPRANGAEAFRPEGK